MKPELVIIIPELTVVWNPKENQLVFVTGLICIFYNYIKKGEEKELNTLHLWLCVPSNTEAALLDGS